MSYDNALYKSILHYISLLYFTTLLHLTLNHNLRPKDLTVDLRMRITAMTVPSSNLLIEMWMVADGDF